MNQPTREEVQVFIEALKHGMKVSHKPEFLIALAEGWLKSSEDVLTQKQKTCDHALYPVAERGGRIHRRCKKCDIEIVSKMR